MGTFKNIVTLGAAYRVEKKLEEYNVVEKKYRILLGEYKEKRSKVDFVINDFTKLKVVGIHSLEKLSKITERLLVEVHDITGPLMNNAIDLDGIKYLSETISGGRAAISAAGGITTGIGTALGTWALVSTFGVASTGTAIGSISGIAASNAAFAVLGGGTLAAGGGGIAAGMTVMTGLFAIPAIVFTGVFSHMSANKKIRKMDETMIEMNKAIPLIKEEIIPLNEFIDSYYMNIKETSNAIKITTLSFNQIFQQSYKKIYRIPLFSRFIKWFRMKALRKNYFSEEDHINICVILEKATTLVDLLNKDVLNIK